MHDQDGPILPRRTASKIAYIVISLGLVIGLCVAGCWLAIDFMNSLACGFVHIDNADACP
jgi:hypothetical protein